MFTENQKAHFIGIGGIGMSGIAHILLSMGFRVSGSDLASSDITDALKARGAEIFIGHREENVFDDVTVVVTSTAIGAANPEIVAARERRIVIVHRSEMLAEIMRLRCGIAVSGTHGKTTATSLTSHLLSYAGRSPTAVIGGKYFNVNSNATFGESEYFVCEADESDGSFLRLSPVYAIVTNVDNDHLDYYHNEETLRLAFLEFINKIPFYGAAFLCFEDPIVRALAEQAEKRYYSYGFSDAFDLYADKIRMKSDGVTFTAYFRDAVIGEIFLPLLGKHNVLNALAAIGVAVELGVDFPLIAKAFESFQGVGRRLNLVYKDDFVSVYDDYGHHPTEIRATLSALKQSIKGRLIVAFQPHRYSRTEALFEAFAQSFDDADLVVITDVYPAGEQPRPGISGRTIYDALVHHGHANAEYVANKKDVLPFLRDAMKKGDAILTLGAGDIYKAAHAFGKNHG